VIWYRGQIGVVSISAGPVAVRQRAGISLPGQWHKYCRTSP
jgi:hypothetical protein